MSSFETRTVLCRRPVTYIQPILGRPWVVDSLRKAGIRLTETKSEADYILNVKVG